MTLCVTSWTKYIDLDEIVVLNQRNVAEYIGEYVDVEELRMYSFAKQSDIVSAHFLNKFGGTFLDVDTILTTEKSRQFFEIEPGSQKLKYAGNNGTNGLHIGILTSNPGSYPVRMWSDELLRRVPRWQQDNRWDYVGNNIITPIMISDEGQQFQSCYDVSENRITPENQLPELVGIREGTPQSRYKEFWFRSFENNIEVLNAYLEQNGGIICLHNSWTPRWYSSLSKQEILDGDDLLSVFLQKFADFSKFEHVEGLLQRGSVR